MKHIPGSLKRTMPSQMMTVAMTLLLYKHYRESIRFDFKKRAEAQTIAFANNFLSRESYCSRSMRHLCTILHQALERELAPVEERLGNLREIARKVVLDNPQESRHVQAQQSCIIALWEKLKVCV